MKQAMVFAAGLGTRLKPLTNTMPKALVSVGGRPLLEHILLRLKAAGFERIVVNVHHFGEQIIDFLAAQDNYGLDIRISDERQQLLDTGGGIKHAAAYFDPSSPILIHNVDILSNVDLGAFYDHAHAAQSDVPDAVLLVSPRQTKRYLLFAPDNHQLIGWTNIETGQLRGPIAEQANNKKTDAAVHKAPLRLAFAGIHLFSPRLFPLMQAWPDKFSIIDFYLQACATRSVVGFEQTGLRLLDVGKLDSLTEAEKWVAEGF